MVAPEQFCPRIPQPVQPMRPVPPPFPGRTGEAAARAKGEKEETLLSWLAGSLKQGIKALPKMAGALSIQLGIVLAVNLILWPLDTWKLPAPLAALVKALVFLTATYNNVIPKTIYWVIVFTFGKRLFFKVKSEGLARAVAPIGQVVPELKKACRLLEDKSYSLLLAGGGAGLIIANNFASYSRFSEARNKMDKYFVALVISFAVSYLLGEGKKNWMFKFARLTSSDLSRLLKKKIVWTDDYTYVLLSAFVAGLLLDAPLIILKLKYGGYILGLLLAAAGILLPFVNKTGSKR